MGMKHGNETAPSKKGYEVFLLLDDNKTIDYTKKSAFAVSEINADYSLSPIIATIFCHQK